MRVRVWWVAAFAASFVVSFSIPGYWLLTAALLVGVFGVHVRHQPTLDEMRELWSYEFAAARDAS